MEKLLNTKDIAEHYSVTEHTVKRWRREGTGPKFLRMGKKIMYRPEDVRAHDEELVIKKNE